MDGSHFQKKKNFRNHAALEMTPKILFSSFIQGFRSSVLCCQRSEVEEDGYMQEGDGYIQEGCCCWLWWWLWARGGMSLQFIHLHREAVIHHINHLNRTYIRQRSSSRWRVTQIWDCLPMCLPRHWAAIFYKETDAYAQLFPSKTQLSTEMRRPQQRLMASNTVQLMYDAPPDWCKKPEKMHQGTVQLYSNNFSNICVNNTFITDSIKLL